jgi:hypothetical protein
MCFYSITKQFHTNFCILSSFFYYFVSVKRNFGRVADAAMARGRECPGVQLPRAIVCPPLCGLTRSTDGAAEQAMVAQRIAPLQRGAHSSADAAGYVISPRCGPWRVARVRVPRVAVALPTSPLATIFTPPTRFIMPPRGIHPRA